MLDDTDAAREATPTLETARDEAQAALAAVTLESDRDAASMQAQRTDITARVEPTVLADYDRRRDHFHGVAISKVEGRRCGGCRMDLSTSEYEQLVAATPPGSVGDCPRAVACSCPELTVAYRSCSSGSSPRPCSPCGSCSATRASTTGS